MKVLFCSPFLHGKNIYPGGIGIWGKSILDYYHQSGSKIDIIPVSFDRHFKIREASDFGIKRLFNGITDLGQMTIHAFKTMKQVKPDVMHLCTSASLSLMKDLFLLSAAKKRNIKTVLHLHFGRTPELWKMKNWEYRLLCRVIRLADVTVAMDMQTFDILKSDGFNVIYLPNPLSMNIINQVQYLEGSIERISNQMLFVGHALKTKGVYELVEGCADVPAVTLRMVGKCSTEIKAELTSIAQRRDNGNWLTFVGEIAHEEVIKEFFAADAFVFPSYTEGFPNVILEAMACGCPIVSSDVGAIPEMLDVANDPCGICFKPKSKTEVTEAVKKLCVNRDLKTTYSEKAKLRVNNMYAIPKVWEQLTKIWNEVC